jgi:hypothetical protein
MHCVHATDSPDPTAPSQLIARWGRVKDAGKHAVTSLAALPLLMLLAQ